MTRSLLIGSDALGWQEFGGHAVLGVRTKTMPGGDGSLDFTVPGDFAWMHRNVIVPEAQVILRVDGEVDYGGYLVCDPLRHRLGPQDTLALAAAGLWGMAARDSRHSYLGADSDLAEWEPTTIQYKSATGDIEPLEDYGKFTTGTDGRLRIRAEGGRTFDNYAKVRLTLFFDNGLDPDVMVKGMSFSYKAFLPDAWEARIQTCADPWAETRTHEWTRLDSLDTWSAVQNLDFTSPNQCVQLMLFWNTNTPTTPTAAPYISLKNVVWYGRGGGGYVDRLVTIADILDDCATALGVASKRITGLTTALADFVVHYPVSYAAIMEQATLLEAAPVEAYFDHDGSGFRFTANVRPAVIDPARNRLWVAEPVDVRDLVRDWEATPEQVEVIYGVSGEATVPDGTVRAARYPSSVSSSFPLVESVDLTGEPPMTAALASQYAQTIYAARQDSIYSGDVTLRDAARTATGQEVPTVKLRPGDRIGVPSLLDAPAAGLYVQAVSYDYQAARCTATVGEPWDPLGFRPRAAALPVLGSGRGGGAFTSRGRRGLGWSQRR